MLCTLLTKWSALVLKVGVLYRWRSVWKKTGSQCCGINCGLKQLYTAVKMLYC